MISFKHHGNFEKTTKFFLKLEKAINLGVLDSYGAKGVAALSSATPLDTGKTAGSWTYEVTRIGSGAKIEFLNTHINRGINIAIILQYGHGTGTGGWVQGRDYINPAIQPIFDEIAQAVWKEVTSL